MISHQLNSFIELGYDGTQCTYTCPVTCGPGDQICNGGTDMNGCMMPDSCYPTMVKLYWIACLLLNLILTVQNTRLFYFPVLMLKIAIRLVSVINIVLQLVEKMSWFALLMTLPLLVQIQIPACLPLMKVSLYKKKFLLKFFL